MPVEHAMECRMQTNHSIRLRSLKRAVGFGLLLCSFLFCFAAFGAGEISRTYQYKGFDADGKLVVQGTITLRVGETVKVTGDWKLRVLDKENLKKLGPQDGSGKIGGELKGGRIFLNLNPDPHDFGDNIYLDGEVTQGDIFKITGKWGHYGYYAGKIIEGRFEMVRKSDAAK
jgi:hypothetical protein